MFDDTFKIKCKLIISIGKFISLYKLTVRVNNYLYMQPTIKNKLLFSYI